MEIKDYLKVLGKRAWLLVMIPAVAGVVAGLIAVRQPQAFRTTATLQLPHDKEASPAEVAQLVADFRAAINNPTIQNGVSEDTGVPVKRIKRIKVTQVGDSSQLTLGIQDKRRNPTDSKAVIQGLTNDALSFLEAPEVKAAESALDAANGEVDSRAVGSRRRPTASSTPSFREIQSADPEDDLRVARTEASAATQAMLRYQADGQPCGRRAPSCVPGCEVLAHRDAPGRPASRSCAPGPGGHRDHGARRSPDRARGGLGPGRYRQHRA